MCPSSSFIPNKRGMFPRGDPGEERQHYSYKYEFHGTNKYARSVTPASLAVRPVLSGSTIITCRKVCAPHHLSARGWGYFTGVLRTIYLTYKRTVYRYETLIYWTSFFLEEFRNYCKHLQWLKGFKVIKQNLRKMYLCKTHIRTYLLNKQCFIDKFNISHLSNGSGDYHCIQ